MRKIIYRAIHTSLILLTGLLATSPAFGGQYDLVCTGVQPKVKKCSDKVIGLSKCKEDAFIEKICKTWGGPNPKRSYAINEGELYSDIDTRISIPTETYKKKILRYMEEDPVITYAWEKWKDLDFILMIQEESLWQEFILGDNGTSIGYCQISKIHGKELYEEYMNAKDWKSRITLCHDHYLKFAYNVGVVFHGWNSRMRNLPSFTFK